MEPLFGLDLTPLPAGAPRLATLHARLRAAIVDGRLQPGVALPSTRELAVLAGVSRNTAIAAYEQLAAEGYTLARRGSGTRVAPAMQRPHAPAPAAAVARRLQPAWRTAAPPAAPLPPPARHDLRAGYPDLHRFPHAAWRRILLRAWRRAEREPTSFGDPQGDARLREAIARHVSATRSVACAADAVVVTAGAQQALDLLARVLLPPGRGRVVVEDPGYPPAHTAFAATGARLHAATVDAEGICLEGLPATADLVCVTPSHQFPLGVTMSARRRIALLAYARQADAVVVEDDYDAEFRLGGRPLDALQTLDREQRVVYVGTFSKSLFPALRIGFVVAPPWLRAALVAARQRSHWHVPAVMQAALAAFIAEGHLARHVRRMRPVYAGRHAALLAALHAHLRGVVSPVPPLAGLHLSAAVAAGADARRWAAAAAAAGVRVAPLAAFACTRPALEGLVFGIGRIEAAAIDDAIRALARSRPAA